MISRSSRSCSQIGPTNKEKNFAYRTKIEPWIFLISPGLTLFLALITVSFQSIKVALANPIDSLRYE